MMKKQAECIQELEQNIEEMKGASKQDWRKNHHRVRNWDDQYQYQVQRYDQGKVLAAMTNLTKGNMCIPRNLEVNIHIMFNMPSLILLK